MMNRKSLNRMFKTRRNKLPIAPIIYGVLAVGIIAGVTVYAVRRTRSGERLLPEISRSHASDKPETTDLKSQVDDLRRETQIDEDIQNPLYPL